MIQTTMITRLPNYNATNEIPVDKVSDKSRLHITGEK